MNWKPIEPGSRVHLFILEEDGSIQMMNGPKMSNCAWNNCEIQGVKIHTENQKQQRHRLTYKGRTCWIKYVRGRWFLSEGGGLSLVSVLFWLVILAVVVYVVWQAMK